MQETIKYAHNDNESCETRIDIEIDKEIETDYKIQWNNDKIYEIETNLYNTDTVYQYYINELYQITDRIHKVNKIQRSQILSLMKKDKKLISDIKELRMFMMVLSICFVILFITVITEMIYTK